MKNGTMPELEKLDRTLMLIDLSGFTQLIYQASHNQRLLAKVMETVCDFFAGSGRIVQQSDDVEIVNHTGDGFIAMVGGKTPTRAAVTLARGVIARYQEQTAPRLSNVPFRQKVDLRVALHHGDVYRTEIPDFAPGRPLYFGDDINVLARVVNSQTARRFGIGLTRSIYRRLTLGRGEPVADEVIIDRNRYPEQIEVFRLPEEIPEHKPKRKRG